MVAFNGDETAPFFGFLGAAGALVFSCMGAAYGTAKSGVGVASMGVMRPELVMKSIVPVVMAGVLGIYGLIIAVIISTGINPNANPYYLFDGYAHLSSGLACGLAGLSAGMAIGIVGDAGVRYIFSFSTLFSLLVQFLRYSLLFLSVLTSLWLCSLLFYCFFNLSCQVQLSMIFFIELDCKIRIYSIIRQSMYVDM